MFNVGLDGITPQHGAIPVKAENNWWGLRATAARRPTPARRSRRRTNPPFPENPVNGAAGRRRHGHVSSDAVDFFPFRNGSQSDPNTGEFAVFDAPGPVNDAAPTVTLDDRQARPTTR